MTPVNPAAAAERLLRSLCLAEDSVTDAVASALDPASPSVRHLAARRADLARLADEIVQWRADGAAAERLAPLRAAVQSLITEVTADELSLKVNHGEG